MLKEILKVGFLLAAGVTLYNMNKTGTLFNSNAYQFLKENGVVDLAEMFVTYSKAFLNQLVSVAKLRIPENHEDMCVDVEAYMNLLSNMLLVCKNSVISVLENTSSSFSKNFPTAVDDVSVLVSGALTSTKEGLVMISSHLQNFTLSAVNYASEVLRT